MSDDLTADDIRELLALEPNATCGSVRLTYTSGQSIAPGGLPAPFADGRPLGSALYFMVTPVAPVRLHRIRNDQSITTISPIRSSCSCSTPTAAAKQSSSGRTCAAGSAGSD